VKRADFPETEAFWKRPERVVLATSLKPNGTGNIITLGWKMRTSFKPPIFAVSVGKTRYSHELILDAGEFVLAFPGESSTADVLYCGTHSGRAVDKFAGTGFTPLEGRIVRAPIIKECVANFECRLIGTMETGDHTIFAGEVVACWISDSPERIIVSVGGGSGYRPLARGVHHTLGIIA